MRGITGDGRPAAGTVRARIDERSDDGKRLRVTYLAASPIVDTRGRIVRAAGELVGTKDTVEIIVKRS